VSNDFGPPDASHKTAWNDLLRAAALDVNALQPANPTWKPTVPFDEQQAWSGAFPERPDFIFV